MKYCSSTAFHFRQQHIKLEISSGKQNFLVLHIYLFREQLYLIIAKLSYLRPCGSEVLDHSYVFEYHLYSFAMHFAIYFSGRC